jgi:hypothetical protein
MLVGTNRSVGADRLVELVSTDDLDSGYPSSLKLVGGHALGWFDSDAVKRLKSASEFVGGLVADQAFGQLPPGTADEMLNSETQREKLKFALDAAARELGPDKALKKAISAAAGHARMCAQVRNVPWQGVEQVAEDAIRQMVTPAGSEHLA